MTILLNHKYRKCTPKVVLRTYSVSPLSVTPLFIWSLNQYPLYKNYSFDRGTVLYKEVRAKVYDIVSFFSRQSFILRDYQDRRIVVHVTYS